MAQIMMHSLGTQLLSWSPQVVWTIVYSCSFSFPSLAAGQCTFLGHSSRCGLLCPGCCHDKAHPSVFFCSSLATPSVLFLYIAIHSAMHVHCPSACLWKVCVIAVEGCLEGLGWRKSFKMNRKLGWGTLNCMITVWSVDTIVYQPYHLISCVLVANTQFSGYVFPPKD